VFPLAAVLRPNGTFKIGTGLQYPYPYNNGEVVSSGGNPIWQGQGRQNMAQCFVSNAITPYTKSLALNSFTSNVNYTRKGDSFGGPGWQPPALSTLTFNGDLHHFSTTQVTSPSIAIMWWSGNGNVNMVGVASDNPSLNCGNSIDDCQFSSGSKPSSVLSYASQPGDIIFSNTDNADLWTPFSNKRAPFVRTDSSAKSLPQASQTYPSQLSPAGAWSDPFATFAPAGTLYPASYGNQVTFYVCSDPVTVGGGATSTEYTCYFRPDRTK